MNRFARLKSFLAALLFRHRMERDIAQEWQFHLDARAADLVAAGLSHADATKRARQEFGDPLRWKEWGREARGVHVVDEVRQDLAYAVRQILRAPLFAVVAVMRLALGIGANTAIFSVVHALLLRPLPYQDSERLVRFLEDLPAPPGSVGAPLRVPVMDLVEVETLRAHTETLSHVAVVAATTMILSGRNDAIRLDGTQMSASAFPMLGAQAILGRTFGPQDEAPGANAVIVLSHAAWRRHFDSNPSIVGQVLTLDGTGRSVVGVMPEGFEFPDTETEFWIPFVPPRLPPGGYVSRPVIGRVKQGIALPVAASEVNTILRQPPRNRPTPRGAAGPPRFELVRLQDQLVAAVKPALLILTAAVGMVLLIACVNVANLLLARMASQEREFALRLALGAGRGRLIGQVLIESVLLALVGGLAGIGLAFGGVRMLRILATGLPRRDLGPSFSLPRLDEIGIDGSVLVFTLAIAVSTGVVFGVLPAVRHSAQRAMHALRDGPGSSSISGFDVPRRIRVQGLLVVAEIALAMTLFIAGGLLIRSFAKLRNVEPGYDLVDVLTFQVSVPRASHTPAQYITMAEDLAARLQSMRGQRWAGYATSLPMVNGGPSMWLSTTPESPKIPPFLAPPSPEHPTLTMVSRDFLTTLGIRLLAGRGFSEHDRAGQPPVMVVNRAFARSGLLGDNPIGKRVYPLGAATPIEVVGVVEDIRQFGLDQEPVAQVFVDFRQFPPSPLVLANTPFSMLYGAVRTDGDTNAVASSLRSIVRQVEPQATVDNVATLEELVANALSRPRLYAVLLGSFAVAAITLAAVGIYGVMAYAVTRRTREIGIRMTFGATRVDVIRLVLSQSLALTGVGMALGLAGAVAVTRYLGGLLFGLSPLDPITFITVAVAFGLIAMLAAAVPARRATNVDPLVALRYE
jgi:putative ABC transport system permease protein